jgi:hypothetical protein
VRTTLYYGLQPKGAVSDLEWQMFLRDEVTALFPMVDGVAGRRPVARGGRRRRHERSKVLLLTRADTAHAREAVQSVIARHRKSFDQESVLWETARVRSAS